MRASRQIVLNVFGAVGVPLRSFITPKILYVFTVSSGGHAGASALLREEGESFSTDHSMKRRRSKSAETKRAK